MNSAASQVVSRLQMLGLKCDDVPVDQVSSAIAALACFPMYMVANVHAWTSDRQFKVPLFDIPGFEAMREAVVIGEEEGRLEMMTEHRKVVDSMLSTPRPPDRVVYEYAIQTLKEYLAIAPPAVVAKLRTAVARMIVEVAKASGKGIFGTGEKVSPQERDCINHIAAELRLADTPKAAEHLKKLWVCLDTRLD
jgi:hypothetical protein